MNRVSQDVFERLNGSKKSSEGLRDGLIASTEMARLGMRGTWCEIISMHEPLLGYKFRDAQGSDLDTWSLRRGLDDDKATIPSIVDLTKVDSGAAFDAESFSNRASSADDAAGFSSLNKDTAREVIDW